MHRVYGARAKQGLFRFPAVTVWTQLRREPPECHTPAFRRRNTLCLQDDALRKKERTLSVMGLYLLKIQVRDLTSSPKTQQRVTPTHLHSPHERPRNPGGLAKSKVITCLRLNTSVTQGQESSVSCLSLERGFPFSRTPCLKAAGTGRPGGTKGPADCGAPGVLCLCPHGLPT